MKFYRIVSVFFSIFIDFVRCLNRYEQRLTECLLPQWPGRLHQRLTLMNFNNGTCFNETIPLSLSRSNGIYNQDDLIFLISACVLNVKNSVLFNHTLNSIATRHPNSYMFIGDNCAYSPLGLQTALKFSTSLVNLPKMYYISHRDSPIPRREHGVALDFTLFMRGNNTESVKLIHGGSILNVTSSNERPNFRYVVFLQHSTHLIGNGLPDRIVNGSCPVTLLDIPWQAEFMVTLKMNLHSKNIRHFIQDNFIKDLIRFGIPATFINNHRMKWMCASHGVILANMKFYNYLYDKNIIGNDIIRDCNHKACWESVVGLMAAYYSPECLGIYGTIKKQHGGNV
jgi:hypothetical protein